MCGFDQTRSTGAVDKGSCRCGREVSIQRISQRAADNEGVRPFTGHQRNKGSNCESISNDMQASPGRIRQPRIEGRVLAVSPRFSGIRIYYLRRYKSPISRIRMRSCQATSDATQRIPPKDSLVRVTAAREWHLAAILWLRRTVIWQKSKTEMTGVFLAAVPVTQMAARDLSLLSRSLFQPGRD